MRAGAADDRDQRVSGGEAGGEGHATASLELAEGALERHPRRIRGTGVVVLANELARSALCVGGGLVDRRDH